VENNFSFSSQRKTPRIRTEEQEEKKEGNKKVAYGAVECT
jgi:hypothetical protein